MAEGYANTWVSQYGDDPGEPGQWLDTLAELKQLPDNWRELLRQHHPKWPPNPFEFYNLMVEFGSLHGLPPISEAWEIAKMLWLGVPRQIAYKDCHPMFHHMAIKGWFSTYDFRIASIDQVNREHKRNFREAYSKCVEHAQLGRAFEAWEDRDLLTDESKKPLPRDEQKKRLKQLREELDL